MKLLAAIFIIFLTASELAAQDTLVVGIDQNFFPIEFAPPGGPALGLVPDLIRSLEGYLNQPVKFYSDRWGANLHRLDAGQIDVIEMVYSPERAENYLLSQPITYLDWALFINITDTCIHDTSDLVGKNVVFGRISLTLQNSNSLVKKSNPIFVSGISYGLKLLASGRADALIAIKLPTKHLIEERNYQNIKIVQEKLFPRALTLAVRPDNSQLINKLDQGISALKKDGTLADILKRWTEKRLAFDNNWWQRNRLRVLLLLAVLFIGAISMGFRLYYFRLRYRRQKLLLLSREAQLATVVRNIGEGVLILKDERITFANKSAEKLLGVTAKELMGKTCGDFLPPETVDKLHQLFTEFKVGHKTEAKIEAEVTSSTGETKILENHYSVDPHNRQTVYVVMRDITQELKSRRLVQEELQRNRRLVRAAEDLLQADTEKEVLTLILQATKDLNGASKIGILTFDEEGELDFRVWENLSDNYRQQIRTYFPWKRNDLSAKPVIVPDVTKDKSLKKFVPLFREEGIAAMACFPFIGGKKLLGKIVVYYGNPREFSPQEISALQLLVEIGVLALRRLRSRKALEASEAKYRRLVDQALLGVYISDLEGNIHLANKALVKMLGYKSLDELLAVKADMLYAEPDKRHAFLTDLRKTDHLISRETTLITTKGERRVFLETATLVDGLIEGTLLDITERKAAEKLQQEYQKQLEEEIKLQTAKLEKANQLLQKEVAQRRISENNLAAANAMLHAVLESPKNIIIFALDRNYRYTAFNSNHKREMKRIWGIDIHLGMNMLDAIKNVSDRRRAKRNFDRALKGEQFTLVEMYGEEPNRFWYENIYNPIKDETGQIVGLTVFLSDITRRKQTEQALEQYRQRLEIRVAERTAELQRLNEALQRDIKLREKAEKELKTYRHHLEELVKSRTADLESFTYTVSHDLRAPLRAINGFANIVNNDYGDKLPDEAKNLLALIQKNTIRMGQLIDDLLALSRVGRTELNLTLVDMEQLVHDTIRAIQQENPKQHIDWRVSKIKPTPGDRRLLLQVWDNLLRNAVKFSQNRNPARIEIGSRENDIEVEYYVQDNGIGFDKAYAEKIFGVFQRVHANEGYEGTGVGLSIVARVVGRHGGRVWAEGKPGEGARFTFTIPKEIPHEPETTNPESVFLFGKVQSKQS